MCIRDSKMPFLRGLVLLYDTLVTGTRWLVRSATIQALEEGPDGSPDVEGDAAPRVAPAPQRAPREVPCQCCGWCASLLWPGSSGPPPMALTPIPMRQHLDLPPRPTSPVRPPLTPSKALARAT